MCRQKASQSDQSEMRNPFSEFMNSAHVDEWDLERRKADAWNAQEGSLNRHDGIECSKCRNKGYIEVLYGDPETEKFPCVRVIKCDCMRRREIVSNAKSAGLGDMLGKKFTDYTCSEEWQSVLKNSCVEYVKNPHTWLAILGQVGAGKTLLASCVANQLLRDGHSVLVRSWPELCRKAESKWFGYNAEIEDAKNAEILYIDDLFKDGCKGRSEDIAFQILDYRTRNHLITIITSEMLPDDLFMINEGIYSRICMNCGEFILSIGKDTGKDHRRK